MARGSTPPRRTVNALAKRPLWTCPKCGAKLVGRNMWHACGDYSVEKFLAGKGRAARSLFGRFVELIRTCGPFEYAPSKTRVAFMVRVRFAAVTRLSERGMTVAFGLSRKLDSPRIAKVNRYGRWYDHTLRVTFPEELDDEVLGWLREAYKVGEQRHLEEP